MLETLQDRLGKALRNIRGQGRLTEENMAEALKEVRSALLGADVHFRVARQFVEEVRGQIEGQEVLKSVTPGQMVVKIIHDELVKLLGEGTVELVDKKPLRLVLLGLQGSGKTTMAAKLARHLKKQGYDPILIACDVYRPAAIDQLETLAKQHDFRFYGERDQKDVVKIGKRGLEHGKKEGANAFIFDTAGRLQIDTAMVDEVKRLKEAVIPDETLLVADSGLGQEAVNVAKTFHEATPLSGIVLTKLDGDARGGAALSMKKITDVPIKFMGTGEKVEDLEAFHPDRLASRILGMGDVVSLVEKAQDTVDQQEAERLAEKLQRNEFDLADFLAQMQQVKKMGPLGGIMKMLPGMGQFEVGEKEETQMKRTEAIIQAMTPQERHSPQILNASRRQRIALGTGVQVRDVNQLLKQFQQMRKMMKQMKGTKGRRMMKQMQKKQAKEGAGALPDFPGGNFPGLN